MPCERACETQQFPFFANFLIIFYVPFSAPSALFLRPTFIAHNFFSFLLCVFVFKRLVCVCECTAAVLGYRLAESLSCLERKENRASPWRGSPSPYSSLRHGRRVALPTSFKVVPFCDRALLRVVVSAVSSALILAPMNSNAKRPTTTSTLVAKANAGPCDLEDALLRRPAAALARSLVMA